MPKPRTGEPVRRRHPAGHSSSPEGDPVTPPCGPRAPGAPGCHHSLTNSQPQGHLCISPQGHLCISPQWSRPLCLHSWGRRHRNVTVMEGGRGRRVTAEAKPQTLPARDADSREQRGGLCSWRPFTRIRGGSDVQMISNAEASRPPRTQK